MYIYMYIYMYIHACGFTTARLPDYLDPEPSAVRTGALHRSSRLSAGGAARKAEAGCQGPQNGGL